MGEKVDGVYVNVQAVANGKGRELQGKGVYCA
jgi:hypothetical protein